IDPTDSKTVYAGFAMGGVWKSTDGGSSWAALTDAQPSQAIGAIAIDPTHPDTIFVGTGEGNLSGDSYLGLGLYKSTDAGASWQRLAADPLGGVSVSKLACDAAGRLYASTVYGVDSATFGCGGTSFDGTRFGLFQSQDGGASWQALVPAQPVADFDL